MDGGSIEAVVAEARAEVAALADKIRDWELTRIWERKPLVSVRVACGIDLPRCFRDHLGYAGQGRYGTGSERFPCWATAEGASQVSDRASNGFARRLPQVLAQSSHRSQEIATVAIVRTTDSPAPHHTYSIAYVSWLGEFSAWPWLSGAQLSSTWGSPFSTSPRTCSPSPWLQTCRFSWSRSLIALPATRHVGRGTAHELPRTRSATFSAVSPPPSSASRLRCPEHEAKQRLHATQKTHTPQSTHRCLQFALRVKPEGVAILATTAVHTPWR